MARQQRLPVEGEATREASGTVYRAKHNGGAPGSWTVERVTLYADNTFTAEPVKGCEGVQRAVARERLKVLLLEALP